VTAPVRRPAASAGLYAGGVGGLEVAQVLVADRGGPRRVDLCVALDQVVVVVLVLELAEHPLEVDVALAESAKARRRSRSLTWKQREPRLVVVAR
jgi:hypothetical protein